MTQTELNYAVVLYELTIEEDKIKTAEECFKNVPMLKEILANPTVENEKKWNIIERVFPQEMHSFLKKVSDSNRMKGIENIFKAYYDYKRQQEGIIRAELFYVTVPSEEQKQGFVTFVKKEYGCRGVELQLKEDKNLLGGFLLKIGNIEYDYSLMGRIHTLRQQLIRR